ncbi:hypothetical protein X081_02844, partial [Mycobacterium tuberculosis BTB04-001]
MNFADQTQNPERGRKHFDDNSLTTNFQSRQTQNPERGRKHIPRVTAGAHHSSSRQTQNPERGRKLEHGAVHMPWLRGVVRPKTPRGDGNLNTEPCTCRGSGVSSDPKPREGTETFAKSPRPHRRSACRQTQNPERGRKPASGKSVRSKRFQRVVRPKTPRGDVNSKSSTTSAAAACSRSRQTQNPERGRKREEPSHLGLPPAGRQTQNPERGRK